MKTYQQPGPLKVTKMLKVFNIININYKNLSENQILQLLKKRRYKNGHM